MRQWFKRLFVAATPLLLTGCLWGPGKFTSTLMLNKAGTFTLDYKGEILLQIPSEMMNKPSDPWKDDMARCFKSGKTEIATPLIDSLDAAIGDSSEEEKDEARPCKPAEIAALKSQYEADQAKERNEAEAMMKALGVPGLDEESNKAFAAKLMKYAGWRSVSYRGNGIYDVDYHLEGKLSQDFIFPMMPDSEFFIPFIAIRRRNDGSVFVNAPAMSGDPGPMGAAKAMESASQQKPVSRAQGRLTIITDGEILTNNSEDGPTARAGGREVHWDIDPSNKKVPETLIRLQ